MKSITMLTLSVPTELLEAMDRKLVRGGESRSAVIRRLIEDALRVAEDREEVERWVQSYRDMPQTEDEAPWPEDSAPERLAERPPRRDGARSGGPTCLHPGGGVPFSCFRGTRCTRR